MCDEFNRLRKRLREEHEQRPRTKKVRDLGLHAECGKW